jgi:hypothetical protein
MSNESIIGGYPHLTEKILNLLDARNLANAELVCRQWRSFIADGRYWKKYLLSKKVKPRFDFFIITQFIFCLYTVIIRSTWHAPAASGFPHQMKKKNNKKKHLMLYLWFVKNVFEFYHCRIWDAETGLCLREIQEPKATRYPDSNHLVGWESAKQIRPFSIYSFFFVVCCRSVS